MPAKLVVHSLELLICLTGEQGSIVSRGPLLETMVRLEMVGMVGLLDAVLFSPDGARSPVSPIMLEIWYFTFKVG